MKWHRSAALLREVSTPPILAHASSVLDSDVIDAARLCLEKAVTGHAWSFEEPAERFECLCALVAERLTFLETFGEHTVAADLEGASEAIVDVQIRLRWLDWVVGGVAAKLWIPGACSYLLRGLTWHEVDPSNEETSVLAELARETVLFSDMPLEALPLIETLAMNDRSVLHQIARVRALRLDGAPLSVWHDQMKRLLLQAGPPFLRGGLPNPVVDSLAPELAEGLSGSEPQTAISWMQEWLRLHDDLPRSLRALVTAPRQRVRFVAVLLRLLRLYVEVGDAEGQRSWAGMLVEDLNLGDAPLDPAVSDDCTVSEHATPRAHLLDGMTEIILIDTGSTDRTPPDPERVRDWIEVGRKARTGSTVLLTHGLPAPTISARTRRNHPDLGAALETELKKQIEESGLNDQGTVNFGPFPCQTQLLGDESSRHTAIWFTLSDSDSGRWAVAASINPENGRRFSYRLRVGLAARGPSVELTAALAAPRPAAVNSLLEEVDRLLKRAQAYL